jgi:hypothetical protein
MLMGLRIAEIDQHPVAHVFGDETAGLRDEIGAAMVVQRSHACPRGQAGPRLRSQSPMSMVAFKIPTSFGRRAKLDVVTTPRPMRDYREGTKPAAAHLAFGESTAGDGSHV